MKELSCLFRYCACLRSSYTSASLTLANTHSLTIHPVRCPIDPLQVLAQVFARVSPDQKELVLRTLRAAGWTTLMCGDGTNDVGALKAAHVGVALLPPSEAQVKAQKEREEQLRQRQKDIAARKAAMRCGRPLPPSETPAASIPTLPAQLLAPSPNAQGLVAPAGPGTAGMLNTYQCTGAVVVPFSL